MIEQIFLLPQVKQTMIISNKQVNMSYPKGSQKI